MMGKKRHQKTKELAVAIAEASSTGEQPQTQTPRKRGRPRKVVIEKTEAGEKKEAEEATEEIIENQSKRVKTSEEEQELQVKQEGPSDSKIGRDKEAAQSENKELPRRSSRRKNKPRKSS